MSSWAVLSSALSLIYPPGGIAGGDRLAVDVNAGPGAAVLLTMGAPTFFATIDAEDHMDPFGIGLARWKPALDVPSGPGLGHDPDPAWLKRYALA